ncbi:MAG: hypothetical protein A2W28_04690 [Gammaproteobacteria bacterium RBG_16_51_14]|nr:MAG: hypothetical protein A2W28_04690 [Gammaproteobacteria bacterium RBG_16_51_14]
MTVYTYHLDTFQIDPDVPILRYPSREERQIREDEPALSVMTDLKYDSVITVSPDETIDTALQIMIHAGVRLLVVLDASARLMGLISGRDILGEKPVNLMTKGKIRRDEIRVRDIMIPRAGLNPLSLHDVEHATVKDIIRTLHKAGRLHAVVVEKNAETDTYYLRGIFSITRIGRQMGVEISADDHAQSFADFEQLLAKDISKAG